jgi:hypothetical protein
MAQIRVGQPLSLSLWAESWAGKQRAERPLLCPVFGLVSALRSLSSVALSSVRVLGLYHPGVLPLPGGTFLLCTKGDISILH